MLTSSMASLGEVLEDFCMLGNTPRNEAGRGEKHCLEGLPNAVEKMSRVNKHLPSVHKAGKSVVLCLPATSAKATLSDPGLGKVSYHGAQAGDGETSLKIMPGAMESWSQWVPVLRWSGHMGYGLPAWSVRCSQARRAGTTAIACCISSGKTQSLSSGKLMAVKGI